jgi:hypothetical protein
MASVSHGAPEGATDGHSLTRVSGRRRASRRSDDRPDDVEQRLSVEGFRQIPGRPGSSGALAGRDIVVCRDEDDRDSDPLRSRSSRSNPLMPFR